MPINREQWRKFFPICNTPIWTCPSCQIGQLKLLEDKFKYFETAESIEHRLSKGKYWDEEEITERFTGILECIKCKDTVIISGANYISVSTNDEEQNPEPDYCKILYPISIYPSPEIFPLLDSYPEEVNQNISDAFSLYWIDNSSCANKIRSSIELLLDELKVRKSEIKKRKRRYFTLHERINIYKRINPVIGSHIEAIKWIGNVGSHSNDIKEESLLDGFELLQYCLDELYNKKDIKRLAKISKQINKRKGIVKRRPPF